MWKKEHFSIGRPEHEEIEHAEIAKQCTKGIVEIGVLVGHTSEIFLTANPKIKVYGIDPIIPDSMNAQLIGSEDKIRQLVKKYPNYTFFKDYSYNVVKNFKEPFDYLFIDGDHTYPAVTQDFNDWFPLLSVGGWLSLHDSAKNRKGPIHWDGSSQLADELIEKGELEYIKTVYCMTIFRKVK